MNSQNCVWAYKNSQSLQYSHIWPSYNAQCMSNEAYSLVYPHNDFMFIKMVQHYTCTYLHISVIKSYIYFVIAIYRRDIMLDDQWHLSSKFASSIDRSVRTTQLQQYLCTNPTRLVSTFVLLPKHITKTRPCNIQRCFTAVKMTYFI